MSLFKTFATDKDLITQGVRFEFEGAGFLCAHAGRLNHKWVNTADRIYKPHRHAIKAGALSNVKAEELELELFLDCVLLNWDNVTDETGSALEFNKDNARWLFKELPALLDALKAAAGEISHYRQSDPDEDAKN